MDVEIANYCYANNYDHQTSVIYAAKYKDIDKLNLMRSSINNYSSTFEYHSHVLNGTCLSGDYDFFKVIMVNYEFSTEQYKNALEYACLGGDYQIVKFILNIIGESSGSFYNRPLSHACVSGNVLIIGTMIRLGGDEESGLVGAAIGNQVDLFDSLKCSNARNRRKAILIGAAFGGNLELFKSYYSRGTLEGVYDYIYEHVYNFVYYDQINENRLYVVSAANKGNLNILNYLHSKKVDISPCFHILSVYLKEFYKYRKLDTIIMLCDFFLEHNCDPFEIVPKSIYVVAKNIDNLKINHNLGLKLLKAIGGFAVW